MNHDQQFRLDWLDPNFIIKKQSRGHLHKFLTLSIKNIKVTKCKFKVGIFLRFQLLM